MTIAKSAFGKYISQMPISLKYEINSLFRTKTNCKDMVGKSQRNSDEDDNR